MRLYIAALLFLAAVEAARAQEAPYDWRPVNRETASMLRAGNDDLAAPYVENGLASCPRAVNPREAALCTAIFQENRSTILENAGGADVLFRQALDIAAPGGDWHNAVWAQIAPAAAIAAERIGDIARSIQLRRDAYSILPAAASRETRRWL